MPETTNETYHPMAFDAIKIGLASPEKIRSWTHRTPEPADKPSKQWKDWWEQGAVRNPVCRAFRRSFQGVERLVGSRRCKRSRRPLTIEP